MSDVENGTRMFESNVGSSSKIADQAKQLKEIPFPTISALALLLGAIPVATHYASIGFIPDLTLSDMALVFAMSFFVFSVWLVFAVTACLLPGDFWVAMTTLDKPTGVARTVESSADQKTTPVALFLLSVGVPTLASGALFELFRDEYLDSSATALGVLGLCLIYVVVFAAWGDFLIEICSRLFASLGRLSIEPRPFLDSAFSTLTRIWGAFASFLFSLLAVSLVFGFLVGYQPSENPGWVNALQFAAVTVVVLAAAASRIVLGKNYLKAVLLSVILLLAGSIALGGALSLPGSLANRLGIGNYAAAIVISEDLAKTLSPDEVHSVEPEGSNVICGCVLSGIGSEALVRNGNRLIVIRKEHIALIRKLPSQARCADPSTPPRQTPDQGVSMSMRAPGSDQNETSRASAESVHCRSSFKVEED